MKNVDHIISKKIYDVVHASPVFTFFAVVGARYMIYVLALFLVLITPDVFPLFTSVSRDRVVGTGIIVGGVWFITFLLQIIVRRKRPFECKIYEAKIPMMCKTPSFPSSHASISFAMMSLGLMSMHDGLPTVFSLVVAAIFIVIACWIALSRVAVGVHYLSDILVGSILGFVLPWVYVIIAFTYGG